MQQDYAGFGIRFRFPDDWELSEEVSGDQVSITVSSPETAFWSVTVLRDRPEPVNVLRAAVLAYQEEYEELEVTESDVEWGATEVPAVEISFVSLELINTASLHALQTSRFTLLVLTQLNDRELQEHGPVLERISASLAVETGS